MASESTLGALSVPGRGLTRCVLSQLGWGRVLSGREGTAAHLVSMRPGPRMTPKGADCFDWEAQEGNSKPKQSLSYLTVPKSVLSTANPGAQMSWGIGVFLRNIFDFFFLF